LHRRILNPAETRFVVAIAPKDFKSFGTAYSKTYTCRASRYVPSIANTV